MTRRAMPWPLGLAFLFFLSALLAPAKAQEDGSRARLRQASFGALFEADLKLAELSQEEDSSQPQSRLDHSKVCRSLHIPSHDFAKVPFLKALSETLASATAKAEDHQVFFRLYSHSKDLLEKGAQLPTGFCVLLRASQEGAKACTSYQAAAAIQVAGYQTLLRFPELFLGTPRQALVRGLRVAREVGRTLEPRDRRLVLKQSLFSFSRCREMTPFRPLGAVMIGAGDSSILPDPDEASDVLDAFSASLSTPGLEGLAQVYQAVLEMAAAARTPKARYWFPYTATERLLQTDEIDEHTQFELARAKKKAFELGLEEGAELLHRIYRELLDELRERAS